MPNNGVRKKHVFQNIPTAYVVRYHKPSTGIFNIRNNAYMSNATYHLCILKVPCHNVSRCIIRCVCGYFKGGAMMLKVSH